MPKDLTRTERRRELRNGATFAERILWYSLRGAQLDGRKFRRQHGIGPYIVDFYCPEERLAIELDGSIHEREDIQEQDVKRESDIVAMGVTRLRFSNEECLEHSEVVLTKIREIWTGRERLPPQYKAARSRATRQPKNSTPLPPPLSEEGE